MANIAPKLRKPSRIAMERREDLRRAAIEAISQDGFEATTVASICEKAGFSRGLIGHYFQGKDDLLLAAVQAITAGFAENTQKAVNLSGDDPADRLHGVVRASFSPPNFTDENTAVWAALVGAARWSPKLAAIYRDLWADYRRGIARLVKRAATDRGLVVDHELAAITFSQLIEGFTVGWAIDSTQFRPERAAAACHLYLDLLLARPKPSIPPPTKAAVKRAPRK
jgi:TetR/AcrR family transcriptional repressor of bet genes